MPLPEDAVVGDLGANNASDNATAVHSHSQLQSGARLVLHNVSVKMFFVSTLSFPNGICPCNGYSLFGSSKSQADHLNLKGEYLS